MQPTTDPAWIRAKTHVKHVRDFWYHFMVYVFVNGLLVILDVRAGLGSQPVLGLDWAYWVILFWGIGLVGHGIYAFTDDFRVQKAYEAAQTKDLTTV